MVNEPLEQYFNHIYNETITSVSRFVVSKCGNLLDSEDILQNIYARFYQRISKKGYKDIENPEAFLINIAKYECKTYFGVSRKKQDTQTVFSDFTEEQAIQIEAEMSRSEKNLEDVLCNQVMAQQIFDEIANQDEVTGRIFYLHFVCDMKLDEIANVLNMNLSSVKNKLYRTIERQRKKYFT